MKKNGGVVYASIVEEVVLFSTALLWATTHPPRIESQLKRKKLLDRGRREVFRCTGGGGWGGWRVGMWGWQGGW